MESRRMLAERIAKSAVKLELEILNSCGSSWRTGGSQESRHVKLVTTFPAAYMEAEVILKFPLYSEAGLSAKMTEIRVLGTLSLAEWWKTHKGDWAELRRMVRNLILQMMEKAGVEPSEEYLKMGATEG